MNLFFDAFARIHFSSPLLVLICVPLLAVLFFQTRGRNRKRKIFLSDTHAWKREKIGDSWLRWARVGLLALMCVAIGITWARPYVLVPSPSKESTQQELAQQFLFLIDLSASMASVEKIAGDTGGVGLQRFEVVRQAFEEFVEREKNARIGLILFSDEAFVAAYPTHDHLFLEKAILQESISHASQLSLFSQGTSIANALDASVKVLDEEAAPSAGRAVILVTDLGDDAKGVVAAIARLRKADARVYVVGVEMDQDVAESITQRFGADARVKLYSTVSSKEISYAFQDISTRESATIFSRRASNKTASTYVPVDLFMICASIVFVLVVCLAVASETIFFFFAPLSKMKGTPSFLAKYILRLRRKGS